MSLMEDTCESVETDLIRGSIACIYDSIEEIDNLPSFTFSLSEEGSLFRIPLSKLITSQVELPSVRDGGVELQYRITLGIVRSGSFSYHTSDKIIFGMLPMELFYVAINTDEHRIGLYQNITINSNITGMINIQ